MAEKKKFVRNKPHANVLVQLVTWIMEKQL